VRRSGRGSASVYVSMTSAAPDKVNVLLATWFRVQGLGFRVGFRV
jgi:hypothetical protein